MGNASSYALIRVLLAAFVLVAVAIFWIYRQERQAWLQAIETSEPPLSPPDSARHRIAEHASDAAPLLRVILSNCSTDVRAASVDLPKMVSCFTALHDAAVGQAFAADGFPMYMCPKGSPASIPEGLDKDHCQHDGTPLVVHLVPDEGANMPTSVSRLLHSFLATQCCSSTLWLWLDDGGLASLPNADAVVTRFALPSHAARRIQIRRLDPVDLWRRIVAQPDGTVWKELSAFGLEALPPPLANRAGARLLVAAAWGGVLVDRYTILLSDLSPLLLPPPSLARGSCIPAFFYRWSAGVRVYPAMLSFGGCGCNPDGSARISQFSRKAIALMARGGADVPSVLTAALVDDRGAVAADTVDNDSDAPPRLFPSLLFDPLWMRHDGVEAPSILAEHLPGLRNMPGYFSVAVPPIPLAAAVAQGGSRALSAASMVTSSFFAGAFAHNWHHKDDLAAEPGSWSEALDTAMRTLAAAKYCAQAPSKV